MAVAITRYFENIRYYNSIYQTLAAADASGATINYASIVPSDVTLLTITNVKLTDQVDFKIKLCLF